MPYTFPNDSEYRLVLLDTNVLSEVSKGIMNTQNGFFLRFPPDKYAPCFSTYSLFEIYNADTAYKAFLKFFAIYPCLMLTLYRNIISEEISCYKTGNTFEIVFNAFSPVGPNKTYDIKEWVSKMWDNKDLVAEIHKNEKEYPSVAAGWQMQRSSHSISYSNTLEKDNIKRFLHSIDPNWICENPSFDYLEFPGARMMLFSQYMRVHGTKKVLKKDDVNDVMISSAMPYIDAVITENAQAEIIKQAKSKIGQLKNLEIVRLSEIREKQGQLR